jgi:hypothetical protein
MLAHVSPTVGAPTAKTESGDTLFVVCACCSEGLLHDAESYSAALWAKAGQLYEC